MTTRSVFIIRR